MDASSLPIGPLPVQSQLMGSNCVSGGPKNPTSAVLSCTPIISNTFRTQHFHHCTQKQPNISVSDCAHCCLSIGFVQGHFKNTFFVLFTTLSCSAYGVNTSAQPNEDPYRPYLTVSLPELKLLKA